MTRYLDLTNTEGCIGFIPENGETVICTGVSFHSMPLSVKKKEGKAYAAFARDYGISFLFDDDIPAIDFYSVPRVDIAAVDRDGGFIASVGEPFSLHHRVPLIYISKERKAYLITSDSTDFLPLAAHWKDHLQPYDGVALYASREDARTHYKIEDAAALPEYRRLQELLKSPGR